MSNKAALVVVCIVVIVVAGIGAFVLLNAEHSHLVKYDTNGGSTQIPDQIITENELFRISDYTGVREGYEFVGWSFNGGTYNPGTYMTMQKNDIIFVAVWKEIIVHNVYYNVNNGSGTINTQTIQENKQFTIVDYKGSKAGYYLTGWSENGFIHSPNSTMTMGNSDIYLKAIWQEKKPIKSEGKCGDDVTWALFDDNVLEISGSGPMYNWLRDKSPWFENDSIEVVIINEGVTSIGSGSFSFCTSIVTVETSPSVKTIGSQAFTGCISLNGLILGYGLETINNSAFDGCFSLYSVNLPDSLKVLETGVFQLCHNLTYVTLSSELTSIGTGAFNGCPITSIDIPAKTQYIEQGAFSCPNLLSINVNSSNPYYVTDEYGVLFNKEMTILLAYPAALDLSSYHIPSTVKIIGKSAFNSCTKLASIDIPSGVTEIMEVAFIDCSSLTSITIPSTVTHIGFQAFAMTQGVTKLSYLSIPSTVISIEGDDYIGVKIYDKDGVTTLSNSQLPGYTYSGSNGVLKRN